MEFLNKIKDYFKAKWEIAKEVLVRRGKEIWAIIKTKTVEIAQVVWEKTKELFVSLKNKIMETLYDLKTALLTKEIAFLEKIGDWVYIKAEELFKKLMERLGVDEDSIPDGDSEEVETIDDSPSIIE